MKWYLEHVLRVLYRANDAFREDAIEGKLTEEQYKAFSELYDLALYSQWLWNIEDTREEKQNRAFANYMARIRREKEGSDEVRNDEGNPG